MPQRAFWFQFAGVEERRRGKCVPFAGGEQETSGALAAADAPPPERLPFRQPLRRLARIRWTASTSMSAASSPCALRRAPRALIRQPARLSSVSQTALRRKSAASAAISTSPSRSSTCRLRESVDGYRGPWRWASAPSKSSLAAAIRAISPNWAALRADVFHTVDQELGQPARGEPRVGNGAGLDRRAGVGDELSPARALHCGPFQCIYNICIWNGRETIMLSTL